MTCFKEHANRYTTAVLQGPFLAVRISPARPYTYQGADVFGPIKIRYAPHSPKTDIVYVVVFVCLNTKNIQGYVIKDLSTDEFL